MQFTLTDGVLPQRTIGGNRLEAIICSACALEMPERQFPAMPGARSYRPRKLGTSKQNKERQAMTVRASLAFEPKKDWAEPLIGLA
jgi:hypothetical protein